MPSTLEFGTFRLACPPDMLVEMGRLQLARLNRWCRVSWSGMLLFNGSAGCNGFPYFQKLLYSFCLRFSIKNTQRLACRLKPGAPQTTPDVATTSNAILSTRAGQPASRPDQRLTKLWPPHAEIVYHCDKFQHWKSVSCVRLPHAAFWR
jgi:hypothetical protein